MLDASDLWGKDIFETTDLLFGRYGGRDATSVIAIGRSGEQGIAFSLAMIDKVGTVGRGGLGAILGSKKVKAIVAHPPRSRRLAVFDREKMASLVNDLRRSAVQDPHRRSIVKGYLPWNRWVEAGLCTKNWTTALSDADALALYSKAEWDEIRIRAIGCYSCLVPDKHVVRVNYGGSHEESYFSSYANALLYPGALCNIRDRDQRVFIFDQANRSGVDIICFTSLVSFLADLFEDGILTLADTGGIELKMDFRTTARILEIILKKDGFGEILSGGIKGLVSAIPASHNYSCLIKGMSPPLDPRNLFGTEHLEFVVNPRGPQIAPGESISLLPGRSIGAFQAYAQRLSIPREAMERIFANQDVCFGRLLRYVEDWYSLQSSLGICMRPHVNRWFSPPVAAELYYAVTGVSTEADELLMVGERAWNLLKVLNMDEGFSREQDRFPEKWFSPLKGDRSNLIWMDYFRRRPITREASERMLDNYYDERGWDVQRGVPSASKLQALGIQEPAWRNCEGCTS